MTYHILKDIGVISLAGMHAVANDGGGQRWLDALSSLARRLHVKPHELLLVHCR
jgi:hypothetical protein